MNDIKRLIIDDIREKKRTGSGVFHKTGKRGYVGKMLTPTDFMSRKEKREYTKASKVQVRNMYDEIMDWEEFMQLSDDQKRLFLSKWRERHKNEEIMEALGVGKNKFYQLIDELGVETIRTNVQKVRYSEDEMQQFKENFIDYDVFISMEYDQQKEILDAYLNRMTTKELAEKWDVRLNNIYLAKTRIKKWEESQMAVDTKEMLFDPNELMVEEKQEKKSFNNEIFDPNELMIAEESTEYAVEEKKDVKENKRKQKEETKQSKTENEGLFVGLNGIYDGEKLSQKLQALAELLMEDEEYEIRLEIKEKR
jgi:hypothetical protein